MTTSLLFLENIIVKSVLPRLPIKKGEKDFKVVQSDLCGNSYLSKLNILGNNETRDLIIKIL